MNHKVVTSMRSGLNNTDTATGDDDKQREQKEQTNETEILEGRFGLGLSM
jgi:hypothetical protein